MPEPDSGRNRWGILEPRHRIAMIRYRGSINRIPECPKWLDTVIDFHGVAARRRGESDNRIDGRKASRAAIGARIKKGRGGESPMTIYRPIASGRRFGANP